MATVAARERQFGLWLGALPFAALAILFLYPVGKLLLASVEGGSLAHYERALFDGLYIEVYGTTFRIALMVTVGAALLGYPIAHFIATASPGWAAMGLLCVMLPFWTSLLVRTYAWMVLLGRGGLVNKALVGLDLIERPIALLHNETGVLIGMIHVLLPYFVFPVYAVMRRVDPNLLAAAEGLGASWWRVFWHVYLPLTLPGVIAGATLVFILSLGFFITPALLGGGKVIMIAVLIEQQVHQLHWAFAATLSSILLLITVGVSLLFSRALGAGARWH